MLFRIHAFGVTAVLARAAACLLLLCAGAVQAKPLASPALESCGVQLEPPQDCPQCQGEAVFEIDGFWHGLGQCTRDIRDAWRRFGPDQTLDLPGQPQLADFVRDQLMSEMAAADVRFIRASDGHQMTFAESFGPDLRPATALSGLVLINDRGEAYNGMGQTGLAYFLLQFAVQADKGGYAESESDADFYRLLGRAALASVLTPVAEGGLTTTTRCALAPDLRCSWYHSVTRRDLAGGAGGTLNQMLHVLRDIAQIDQMASRQGWALDLDLPDALEAGLNQLFLSGGYQGPGTAPDLADFNSGGRANPAPTAWAYYGFNTLLAAPGKGYFLKDPGKNCSYHIHDVDLLQSVLARARTAGIANQARSVLKTRSVLKKGAGHNADEAAATMAAFIAAIDRFDTAAQQDPADLPAQISCSAASRAKMARLRPDLPDLAE